MLKIIIKKKVEKIKCKPLFWILLGLKNRKNTVYKNHYDTNYQCTLMLHRSDHVSFKCRYNMHCIPLPVLRDYINITNFFAFLTVLTVF